MVLLRNRLGLSHNFVSRTKLCSIKTSWWCLKVWCRLMAKCRSKSKCWIPRLRVCLPLSRDRMHMIFKISKNSSNSNSLDSNQDNKKWLKSRSMTCLCRRHPVFKSQQRKNWHKNACIHVNSSSKVNLTISDALEVLTTIQASRVVAMRYHNSNRLRILRREDKNFSSLLS